MSAQNVNTPLFAVFDIYYHFDESEVTLLGIFTEENIEKALIHETLSIESDEVDSNIRTITYEDNDQMVSCTMIVPVTVNMLLPEVIF